MGRVPPVKPPDDQLDALPGVVITPCKCDVMPGYARLNKQEKERDQENKQTQADNLRSMERTLDKQATSTISDQHTWENTNLTLTLKCNSSESNLNYHQCATTSDTICQSQNLEQSSESLFCQIQLMPNTQMDFSAKLSCKL